MAMVNPHIFTHDDRAGALVDHHLRHHVRGDSQTFDHGHKLNRISHVGVRNTHLDRTGILSLRKLAVERTINGLGHPAGGCKIRFVQRQRQGIFLIKI